MIVNQECFKTIKDFSGNAKFRKGNGKPGVYLWGFSLEKVDFTPPSKPEMFFPYYVGKVVKKNGCMYQRTHEHIASLIGGNLSIFDIIASACNGTLIGKVHKSYQGSSKFVKPLAGVILPNPLFANLLHFPEGIHRYHHYFTDPTIISQLNWMAKHFCITYFTPEIYDKQYISNLEKFIGNVIGYDKLITKPYYKPDIQVEIIDNPENFIIKYYEDLINRCR